MPSRRCPPPTRGLVGLLLGSLACVPWVCSGLGVVRVTTIPPPAGFFRPTGHWRGCEPAGSCRVLQPVTRDSDLSTCHRGHCILVTLFQKLSGLALWAINYNHFENYYEKV